MITADFIEVTHRWFKPDTFNRVQFGEIESELLPKEGDCVVIDSTQYKVEQVTFYPFRDSENNKDAIVYIRRL